MKFVKFIISFLAAAGLTYVLNRPLGAVPALGRLFNPFEGFWQNGESKLALPPTNLQLDGVKEEVDIVFDDNRVPHVLP
jgi:penicillin amidase